MVMVLSETREKYLRNLSKQFRDTVLSERLYLQPHLSLADVAERLGSSWYDLSYSINTYLEMSFIDYINGLRIKDVLLLMQSAGGKELKISDLGRMAGFNDRTTFCRACKKLTGLSPSELKEQAINYKL